MKLAMAHMLGGLTDREIEALKRKRFCFLTGLPVRMADKLAQPFTVCGCWQWTGWKSKNGYGRVKVNGVGLTAHRVTYEILIGQIPTGCVLEHLCRNRACVNPFHLVAITQQENVRKGDAVLFRSEYDNAQNNAQIEIPDNFVYGLSA